MLLRHKQKDKTMAKREDTTYFEKKLLEFVGTKDPMLEMSHAGNVTMGNG